MEQLYRACTNPARRAVPQMIFSAAAIVREFTRVLFPPVCAACSRVGSEPFCNLCSHALEPASPFVIEGAAAARACYAYGGPIALAVQALKYRNRPELGLIFGPSLRDALAMLGGADVVVPVPLSPARLRQRGYNQARELARGLDLPVRPLALRRAGITKPQVGLDRKARLENSEGAITAGPQRISGQRVCLVDDVVTTGATASACARALKKAGAVRVVVVALTRADASVS